MVTAVDKLTQAYKTFNGGIDVVLKEPRGPKRWRAANSLWLSLSPKHRRIYREVVRDNQVTRMQVDKFGQAAGLTRTDKADKTLRECLNIPAGAYMFISKADPEAFTLKSNAIKMFKAFPEYCTREVF